MKIKQLNFKCLNVKINILFEKGNAFMERFEIISILRKNKFYTADFFFLATAYVLYYFQILKDVN